MTSSCVEGKMLHMDATSSPDAARFWSKVSVAGGSGCWEWQAARDAKGYGRFGLPGSHRTALAHRYAWQLIHGERPAGPLLHSCDNPACVRPDHLRVGTIAENNDEMWRKGRGRTPFTGALGERNPRSKLTAAEVQEIRRRSDEGETFVDIARSYDCTWQNIRRIVRRETWGHV